MTILKDPTVEFAVLETARGGILRSGLGFSRCDIGIITNIQEDHLGISDIHTLEDLASGNFSNLDDYLLHFRNELQDNLIASLDKNASTGTSNALRQSIQVNLNDVTNGYELEVVLNDYYKFIDQGVQGVGGTAKTDTKYTKKGTVFTNVAPRSPFKYSKNNKPSVKHFSLWSRVKGLNPFAVRESVFRKGITPNYFYSEVVNDKMLNELKENVLKFTSKDVIISLKNEF